MVKKIYCLMVLLFAITVGAQNIVWPTDATAQEVYNYINNLLHKGSYQAPLRLTGAEVIIKQQSNDDGSIWVWSESISPSQTIVSLTNSDGCFLIHEDKSIKVVQFVKLRRG